MNNKDLIKYIKEQILEAQDDQKNDSYYVGNQDGRINAYTNVLNNIEQENNNG